MRLAAVTLVVVLLAGCAASSPSKSSTTTDGATSCRYIPGLSKWVSHQVFDTNFTTDPTSSDTFPASANDLQDEGRPLDRVNLDFSWPRNGIEAVDARIEMRFYRADDGTALKAYDLSKGTPGRSNQGLDVASYGPGRHNNFTLQVHITPPDQDAQASPVRVEWTFVPNLDGNPLTRSRVVVDTIGQYVYRSC